uniref:Probable enoyl-CoA hydratase, mitochondrial n=1 Tax=Trypanosoma congolense (strain IL3000) TaxID=1068625 RepID=F9W8I0_TRYCI|nr:unnamed protein product [Trypanosoma congolense IL3000]
MRPGVVLRSAMEALVKCSQKGAVATLTLNRPDQLNALNKDLVDTLGEASLKCDKDPSVAAIILTGEGKAFCAGADIKAMADKNFVDMYNDNMFYGIECLASIKKPTIAAVNGFALGGGCELVMCCDIVVASERAVFGQPETKIGIIPGIGGTQRLTRLIGKSRAMEWILTGQQYTAVEAERAGLVSRVVKHEDLLTVAMSTAEKIASNSSLITTFAKNCVNRALETSLAEGLAYEKLVFQATFCTNDQKEGMRAFLEKRKPVFTNS